MPRPGSSLPLVRRVLDDGVLRELVHPPDGGPPQERPVGSAAPARSPEPVVLGDVADAGLRRLGQLVGRNVEPRDHARPLALPLLRASCDGSGACCGLYHHVPATRADRDRVLPLLAATWDRPFPLADAFFPAFDDHPDGPLNVVGVDGACAFLDPDGLCSIHKAGGAVAKPQACVTYPASFVVCGERWYASLRPECACVARTALEGPRLADDPHGWAHLRALMLAVWEVPMLVQVTDDAVITRTTYRRFAEDAVAALSSTLDPVAVLRDAVVALDALAEPDGDGPIGAQRVASDARGTDAPNRVQADGDGPIAAQRAESDARGTDPPPPDQPDAHGSASPPDQPDAHGSNAPTAHLSDAWLEVAEDWLLAEVASASLGLSPRSPARRAAEWALACVRALRAGERPTPRSGRGKAADWRRRAALVAAHLLHGHGLLEEDLLRPALVQLARIVAVAEASFLLRPVAAVDPRLEELTTWLYLWRTHGRDVPWESAGGSS